MSKKIKAAARPFLSPIGEKYVRDSIAKGKEDKFKELAKRWREEVVANSGAIDPYYEYTWEGLLLGFLLGAGISLEEANLIVRPYEAIPSTDPDWNKKTDALEEKIRKEWPL